MSCILLQKYFVFPFLIPFLIDLGAQSRPKANPRIIKNRLYRRRPQTCFEYGVTQYGVDGGASHH